MKAATWLLVLILVALSAPAAAQAPKLQSAFTVIRDAKNPTPFFIEFFENFNRNLITWWTTGGKNAVRGQWSIFATEDVSDDGTKRGVVVYAIREGEGERVTPILRVPQWGHDPVVIATLAARRTKEKVLRAEAERQKEATREDPRR